MKSIQNLINDGSKLLEQRDYNNPSLDIQLILIHLLKKDRVYLYAHRDELVDEEIIKRYYEMLEQRSTGYPIQYMLNVQEFMGLELYVEDGVLVPRADTETLVEKIINISKTDRFIDKEIIKILDIGTGSGAIAVSLAHYIKNAQVTAVDISDTAIKVANINKEKFSLDNLHIIKADLFDENFISTIDSKIIFEENYLNVSHKRDIGYGIIVSNPPYIESKEIDKLQIEVAKYEPRLALDGGNTGLLYYEKIKELAEDLICENGILSVEIGHNQADLVKAMFKEINSVKNIEQDKDLYGNDRVITAYF
jgi:release factor glutamine methyltransferase